MKANCIVCVKKFDTRTSGITCSKECRLERNREKAREYRARNPEKFREYDRKSYAANPDKKRKSARRYRAANPDKKRESGRNYRAAHAEKMRESSRRWKDANKDKCREIDRRSGIRRKLKRQFGLPLIMFDAMLVEAAFDKFTEEERISS